jgi:hypothetical protein
VQRLAGGDEARLGAELKGRALHIGGDQGKTRRVSNLNQRRRRQHPQERGLAVGGGPHG